MVLLFALHRSGTLDVLSENCLDFYFFLRGPVTVNQKIVIIGIDDKSLARLGRWPFSRQYHAQLIKKISKAKVIGFDILYPEEESHDSEFSKSMAEGPPVTLAMTETAAEGSLLPSRSLSGYTNVGHILPQLSSRGIIRQVPLQINQYSVLSQAMIAATHPVHEPRVDDSLLYLNFYGPENTFPFLSYIDVLEGKISPDFFADRYVLVGARALGLHDVHITPFSKKIPTPGVEIQATILNNLLDGTSLQFKSTLSWLLAAILFITAIFFWPYIPELWNLAIVFISTILLLTLSFVFFTYNIVINPVPSLFAIFLPYLVYIIFQGIFAARHLFRVTNELRQKLDQSLQSTYINIPRQFLQIPNEQKIHLPITGEVGTYLEKMHEGILALNLQNRFIQHLLSEETPPIILWGQEEGEVVFASSQFRNFWISFQQQDLPLPRFDAFKKIIQSCSLPGERDDYLHLSPGSGSSPKKVDVNMILNGRKSYFQILMQPVTAGESNFSGILAIFTDVTELRELERLKSEVLSIVSHELRLPLTTILGYSEMLSEILPKNQSEYAEEICKQTQRLNRMIDSFLDITRIESGKYVFRFFPLDVICVVHDALAAVEYSASQKEVSINSIIPRKCSPIFGDEPLLLQMLINLLDNAIKFSPHSSTVRFTLQELDRYLLIEIQDEGHGIDSEEKEFIFNKFHRCKNVHEESGFGLGLSLVQQVIQGHNGTIELTRLAPEGACFRVLLPKGFPQ